MPDVPPRLLRRHRRLRADQERRHRLGRGDDGAHEGLEDALIRRRGVLSPPKDGHGGWDRNRRTISLRKEGLLSRWSPALAAISKHFSTREATVRNRRAVADGWLRLVLAERTWESSLAGTNALPPRRTDGSPPSDGLWREAFGPMTKSPLKVSGTRPTAILHARRQANLVPRVQLP